MKIKTSKSASKRIKKITKNGKILINKMSAQHRLKGKSKRTVSNSKHSFVLGSGDAKKIKRMVPYR